MPRTTPFRAYVSAPVILVSYFLQAQTKNFCFKHITLSCIFETFPGGWERTLLRLSKCFHFTLASSPATNGLPPTMPQQTQILVFGHDIRGRSSSMYIYRKVSTELLKSLLLMSIYHRKRKLPFLLFFRQNHLNQVV